MIFVATGTQLAFPRLIHAMDTMAPELGEPVVAQIGPDTEARAHIETHETLHPARFEELFDSARVVVAHAGIGSILMAKRLRKPLIIVPRRHALGEHRNDHQIATAREVEGTTGVRVAWQIEELPALVKDQSPLPAEPTLSPQAEALIKRLRDSLS
ncbi:MAG: glycosyltransferase [Pseudomonadota bacterium]